MYARRFVTLLAAVLITAGQALLLATDTAARSETVMASAATVLQSSGASGHA
jgi:hypothetical protein